MFRVFDAISESELEFIAHETKGLFPDSPNYPYGKLVHHTLSLACEENKTSFSPVRTQEQMQARRSKIWHYIVQEAELANFDLTPIIESVYRARSAARAVDEMIHAITQIKDVINVSEVNSRHEALLQELHGNVVELCNRIISGK